MLFGREDNDGPDRIKSGSLFIFLYISMTYIRLTTARKMEILSNQEEITSPSACGQTVGYRHSPVVFPAVLKNAWAISFAGPDIQPAHPCVDPVDFLGHLSCSVDGVVTFEPKHHKSSFHWIRMRNGKRVGMIPAVSCFD